MTPCPFSGCNYPEGGCSGACTLDSACAPLHVEMETDAEPPLIRARNTFDAYQKANRPLRQCLREFFRILRN